MSDPEIDIELGACASDAVVRINGQDVTSCLRKVAISVEAGDAGGTVGLTHVELTLISMKARVRVAGAIGIEQIGLAQHLVDATELGSEWEQKTVIPE